MRVVWVFGVVLGLMAAAVALSKVPLAVKLVLGLVVVGIGVAGPLGSVLVAGLLLDAGLAAFIVLLVTGETAAVGSALGVAILLTASGVALSFRELFRNRDRVRAAPTLPEHHPANEQ